MGAPYAKRRRTRSHPVALVQLILAKGRPFSGEVRERQTLTGIMFSTFTRKSTGVGFRCVRSAPDQRLPEE